MAEAPQDQPKQDEGRLGNRNDRGEELYQDEVARAQQRREHEDTQLGKTINQEDLLLTPQQ